MIITGNIDERHGDVLLIDVRRRHSVSIRSQWKIGKTAVIQGNRAEAMQRRLSKCFTVGTTHDPKTTLL